MNKEIKTYDDIKFLDVMHFRRRKWVEI